jgi:anti-anti-sigma factor
MSLDVRETNRIFILTPHGLLLGGKETDELQDRITDLDRAGNERLIINLGETTSMSSMGLAVLFRAQASYAKRGASVKICSVNKRIQQLFTLVRLGLVYGDNVHETEKEALAGFNSPVTP